MPIKPIETGLGSRSNQNDQKYPDPNQHGSDPPDWCALCSAIQNLGYGHSHIIT